MAGAGGVQEAGEDGAAPTLADLLDAALVAPRPERVATRHGGGIPSATCPQKFVCDDNRLYAVKFKENGHGDGRGIFNEQVVALLGALLGAPVAFVALVQVPQALVDELNADKAPHHLNFDPDAGVHHGSRWEDNHSGRAAIEHIDDNRERFGALDVLHAWTGCSGDQQWIYANEAPHAVLSTDHTTFFPAGFGWESAKLEAEQANVAQDPAFSAINLTPSDRQGALQRLSNTAHVEIVSAVARPPLEWGVDRADRLALAEFLLARKDAVLHLLS